MTERPRGPVDPEQLLREWSGITAAARADFDAELARLEASLDEAAARAGWEEFTAAHANAAAALAQRAAKLRARWEGTGPVLEEAVITHSVNSARHLRWRVAEARKTGEALARSFDQRADQVLVRARAAAARALFLRAAEEWSAARACGECGQPYQVGGLSAPAAFRCPSCGAVRLEQPGPETLTWLAEGGAIDAVCDEACATDRGAVEEARHSFWSIHEPTVEDHATFSTVARTAALRWLDQAQRLRPGMTEAEVEARLQRKLDEALAESTHSLAAEARRRRSRGVQLAKAGDVPALLDWLQRGGEGPPAERAAQLVACLHEHGLRAEAWQALALEHHLSAEAEDRDAWMRRRLGELDDALATR